MSGTVPRDSIIGWVKQPRTKLEKGSIQFEERIACPNITIILELGMLISRNAKPKTVIYTQIMRIKTVLEE